MTGAFDLGGGPLEGGADLISLDLGDRPLIALGRFPTALAEATSWYGAESHAYAKRQGRIELIDGERLKYLLKEHCGLDILIGIPNRLEAAKRLPPTPREGEPAY